MTVNLTLRATKGAALTHNEVDANFTALAAAAESPNGGFVAIKPQSGRYSTNSLNGQTLISALIGAANQMWLVPWFAPWDMEITELGVWVNINVGSALGKIVVYGANSVGEPDGAPLYEGGDLDFSTTGYKPSAVSPSLAFAKGTRFWLGIRHSSTATLAGHNFASIMSIDCGATPVITPFKLVRRNGVTYAGAAPSWTYTPTELLGNAIPAAFWLKEA